MSWVGQEIEREESEANDAVAVDHLFNKKKTKKNPAKTGNNNQSVHCNIWQLYRYIVIHGN